MSGAHQPPHHVAAHPAQTNHSKLHRSPFPLSEIPNRNEVQVRNPYDNRNSSVE